MNTVDRVMRAYCSTRQLSDAQRALVRRELETFVNQLLAEGPFVTRAKSRPMTALAPLPSPKTPEPGSSKGK
jgi:hypothetical protein